ncbi:MAG: hypothetical protein AAF618_09205 [Pseudomonadota bacterium]
MQPIKLIAALATITFLAGCLQNDFERAAAGAAAGAVIADATDNDVVTGAIIGGAIGANTN